MSRKGGQVPLEAGQDVWARSDNYHRSFLHAKDDILDATLKKSSEAGLPDIAVSQSQGKFLHLLARSIGARRILEFGTLGGYSTIWLGRALPDDGKLISLELDPAHAKVAGENIANAGLADKVEIIVGEAANTVVNLKPDPPFDLVFIDADKPNNTLYFRNAKRLVRKGGVIIVDNVVRYGRVSDPEYFDESTEGVRALLNYMTSDDEVDATTLAMADAKGYDGFIYALKL